MSLLRVCIASLLGFTVHGFPQAKVGATESLRQTALKVQRSLDKYVSVHDQLFGADSLAEAVSRVVTPMDFPKLGKDLGEVRLGLSSLSRQTRQINSQDDPRVRDFAVVLTRYADSLSVAVSSLERMVSKLARKAREPDFYTTFEYKNDLGSYFASIEKYTAVGKELNAAFRRLP